MEVASHHLAGALALEAERERPRVARPQRVDTLGRLPRQRDAAHARGIQAHVDVVGHSVADVRHRGEEPEELAPAHHRRDREGDVEERVAHEHAAARLSRDVHRADGQAVEPGRDVEADRVESLALAADQELRLALLARPEGRAVVGRARLAVGPHAEDRHGQRLGDRLPVAADLRQGQRIVRRAGLEVGARRQLERPRHVAHDEARSGRRAVGDEELGGEELLQVADVAGDHEHARDLDGLAARQLELDPRRRGTLPKLTLEEHRHDGGQRRQGHAGARGFRRRAEGLRQRHALPVEHTREGDVDRLRLEAEAERELEAEIVVAVEDDPLLADLVEGQGPRLDRGDEDLVDHIDGHPAGHVEHRAATGDDANAAERVIAGRGEGRQRKEQWIGGCGLALRERGQGERFAQPGPGQLGLGREARAHEAGDVGHRQLAATCPDDHAHGGCSVLWNDGASGVDAGRHAQHRQLHLSHLAQRSPDRHRSREQDETAERDGAPDSTAQGRHREPV